MLREGSFQRKNMMDIFFCPAGRYRIILKKRIPGKNTMQCLCPTEKTTDSGRQTGKAFFRGKASSRHHTMPGSRWRTFRPGSGRIWKTGSYRNSVADSLHRIMDNIQTLQKSGINPQIRCIDGITGPIRTRDSGNWKSIRQGAC